MLENSRGQMRGNDAFAFLEVFLNGGEAKQFLGSKN